MGAVSARGDKEAVFSSSEDRIRDGGAAAASMGPAVVQREAKAGLAAVSIHRAAQSSFSLLFPSQCRICGLPMNAREPSFSLAGILVVALPLGQRKRKQGGLNQAEPIAQAALEMLSQKQRLQPALKVLGRTRDTHSQLGLTSHQWRANMRGAFFVPRAQEVTGREVLLVDDVYTTGTTVSECARVLGRAGAREVWVAAVARTLKLASKYEETDTVATTSEADFKVSKRVRNRVRLRTLRPCNLETLKL
jgi:hypothetical protein